MSTERNDTSQTRPGASTATPTPPSYEPPAIAWDEPFAVTIAASCTLVDPLNDCGPRAEA
jgi:hypothetical protein